MNLLEKLFDFLKFSTSISTAFLAINTVLFICLAFKTKVKLLMILALYLTSILIIQNYGAWLAFNGINNLFGTHYYFIIQLLLLAIFYYLLCELPIQKKIIRYSVIACLAILTIQYSIKPELYDVFNELEVFLCSYLLIIYTLFHFYNILGAKKKYIFFNTGLFVYLFGSTVLFLLGNLNIILNLGTFILGLNIYIYTIFQILVFVEGIYIIYRLNTRKFKFKFGYGKH